MKIVLNDGSVAEGSPEELAVFRKSLDVRPESKVVVAGESPVAESPVQSPAKYARLSDADEHRIYEYYLQCRSFVKTAVHFKIFDMHGNPYRMKVWKIVQQVKKYAPVVPHEDVVSMPQPVVSQKPFFKRSVRSKPKNSHWSNAEKKVLRTHTIDEACALLPNRSRQSIYVMRSKLQAGKHSRLSVSHRAKSPDDKRIVRAKWISGRAKELVKEFSYPYEKAYLMAAHEWSAKFKQQAPVVVKKLPVFALLTSEQERHDFEVLLAHKVKSHGRLGLDEIWWRKVTIPEWREFVKDFALKQSQVEDCLGIPHGSFKIHIETLSIMVQ